MDFLPNFGNFGLTIAAFILALSIIVAIHEYGHYIVGRWCGIHAEVFSIGFGPVLFSRMDRHGTRWQVAALPLGGYVKFLGDADPASAGHDGAVLDALDPKERRRSMAGAPLWARSATVAAGPVFNFIMSILIFAGIVLVGGQAVEEARVGEPTRLPESIPNLVSGDLITAIEGRSVNSLGELLDISDQLTAERVVTYEIERAGRAMSVDAAFPRLPLVRMVTPRSAAFEAGIEVGDVILTANGVELAAYRELRAITEQSGGDALALEIWRGGEVLDLTLTPRETDLPDGEGGFDTRYLIGVSGGLVFEPLTESVGLGAALSHGAAQTYAVVTSSLSGMAHIISGAISSCNLQGPIGIAESSGAAARQGVETFVFFIAVLSTAVGLLNLFPIPILDGGHLVFHAYEAISGRAPSEKAMQVLMMIGLGLMLSLMLFALTNDLFC